MAQDGRLTIRFNDLLDDIELLSEDDKRDAGEWIRLQIEKVRDRNQQRLKRLRREKAAAGRS